MPVRKRKAKKAKSGYTWEVYFHKYGYSKSGFRTQREALAHEKIKLAEFEQHGAMTREPKITMDDLLIDYVSKTSHQQNTIYNTERYYRYFGDKYGRIKLKNITRRLLQGFFDEREQEGLDTNQQIKKSLNRLFEHAVDSELLPNNPISKVKVTGIKRDMTHSNYLSHDDFLKLTEALLAKGTYMAQCYCVAVYIGYYGGLRASETLALTRDDIDFSAGVLHVRHKLIYQGRKREAYEVSDTLKSKASVGDVPIHKELIEPLKKWLNINKNKYVICTAKGLLISPDTMSNYVKKVAKSLDIDFHYHALRHTLATNLVFNGINPKVAQIILRHKKIETTLGVYTEVTDTQLQDAFHDITFASV